MIDYVKIRINNKIFANEILNNSFLQFFTPTDHKTGEYTTSKTAKYKGMEFIVYESGRVIIRGSLHKFHNRGLHNYNDFSFIKLIEVLKEMEAKFNLNPMEAYLENVEFGVNVNPTFNPTQFYQNVIAYKRQSFNRMRGNNQIGIDCYFQQYGVKIYDKGKQYHRKENILRIENKCLKMAFLKQFGVVRLSDIADKTKLEKLGGLLLNTFSKVIVNDSGIDSSLLTANELKIYIQCSNPKEWEKFNRKQRHKKVIQFERIIQKYGAQNWKHQTCELIHEKWNTLLKSGDVLTDHKKVSGDVLTTS